MIVTCPNCQTRYNLPDAKIPASGAKVKCSKCTQVFKTPPPQVTPEEEVETLLEEQSPAPDTKAGDKFDETFDEVASGGASKDETPDDDAEGSGPDDDMPGMDDLFDDDEADAPKQKESSDDIDSLFGDDEDDNSDLFGDSGEEDTDNDVGDLFDEEEDSDEDSGDDTSDLFGDDEGEEEESSDYDDDEAVDNVSAGLSLDDGGKKSKGTKAKATGKGSSKSLGCLIVLLIFALVIGGAVYFKVWTMFGLDLSSYFQNVPYIGKLFMETPGGEETAAPGESPADRVRKIELKNVKQYYVKNEKTGNLFVIEGKAVNMFATPKEQIKVEAVLYDGASNVLASQAFLCGNVLSQFQLQVQSQKEIEDGLASEVGILSNNTFIRPGASTPFMAVFFAPPAGVKEFLVKVVDVGDPK